MNHTKIEDTLKTNFNGQEGIIKNGIEKQNYFGKKKIIILVLCFLLTLILIICALFFVFKTKYDLFIKQLKNGLKTKNGLICFFSLIGYMLAKPFFDVVVFWIRLNKLNYKISFFQWFTLAITISFLKIITPGNFVYDPYTLFWMKMNGVPLNKATSIMLVNAWQCQLAQIIVTLPSFIIILFHTDKLLVDQLDRSIFYLMIIGMGTNFIGLILLTMLCVSTSIHYTISLVFNWLKKKLKLKYSTKSQILQKYKNNAIMKKDFYQYLHDWKSTINVFLCVFIGEILVYSSVFFAFSLIKTQEIDVNFNHIFNISNVAYTANKLVLLPGGEFSTQLTMLRLFDRLGNIKKNSGCFSLEEKKDYISNAILIWKIFNSYLLGIIGTFGFCYLTIHQINQYKQKRINN